MDHSWIIFIDLGIISIALLIATFLRAKIPFFQKYLIPNAITAGFLLLPFYNYLAPLLHISSEGLRSLVYHLLSISFISTTLRKPAFKSKKGNIFRTSIVVLSQFGFQATAGLIITLILIATFLPDLFPTIGYFIPLGFALGPGQSYSIGRGWEFFGFTGAGSIGLTFATFGFLWACFGGIFLINYGIKKKWIDPGTIAALKNQGTKTGILSKEKRFPFGSMLTTETEAIDTITFNAAVVLFTYFLTYLLLAFITYLLSFFGEEGMQQATNLWGISFIFAVFMTLIVKKFFNLLNIAYILDNGTLTRISGFSIDFMVAASIGAISIAIVAQYWIPILILCVIGGIITFITVPWLSSRIFKDHTFHRAIMIYGAMTGTMPTGLALLRILDPDFETPVASDYMYACSLFFLFSIPLIIIINFPAKSYVTGDPIHTWISAAVCFAYIIFTFIVYKILAKKTGFKKAGTLWLNTEQEDV
jgi:ESS family glutamate:Na+ symporter